MALTSLSTSLPLLTFLCESLRFSIIVFVCHSAQNFRMLSALLVVSQHPWQPLHLTQPAPLSICSPFALPPIPFIRVLPFSLMRCEFIAKCIALSFCGFCAVLAPCQRRLWQPVGLSAVKQRRHRRTHNAHKAHDRSFC